MRNVFILVLSIVICFAFSACKNGETDSDNSSVFDFSSDDTAKGNRFNSGSQRRTQTHQNSL